MTRGDVLAILRNVGTVDRDLSLQLFFVIHTGRSLRSSCSLRWDEVTEDKLAEVVRYAPLDYAPFIYKYRSASRLSGRLKRAFRELGYREEIPIRELRLAYRRGE